MKAMGIVLFLIFIINTAAFSGELDSGFDTGWAHIDDLLNEDKVVAAGDSLKIIIDRAMEKGHEDEWVEALILSTQLSLSLRQPETAVRYIMELPEPLDDTNRLAVLLYYGHSLQEYTLLYGSEIRRRTSISQEGDLDLKLRTIDQLSQAISKTYLQVWNQREQWDDHGYGDFSPWFETGNYPEHIRGNLKDTLVHMWVGYLQNTSFWPPSHSQRAYRKNVADVISVYQPEGPAMDLASSEIHPLLKISWLLQTLRDDNLKAKRTEAALDAHMSLLKILKNRTSSAEARVFLREQLETYLEGVSPALPWWGMGQWQLGNFYRSEKDPESGIRAAECYQRSILKHPDSLGSLRCLKALASLQSPGFSMESMRQDIPGKRSIKIKHRNVEKIHFRAWRYDLAERLQECGSGGVELPKDKIVQLMEDNDPDLIWSQDINETVDYKNHTSFASIPPCLPGAYIVRASLREDFTHADNRLVSVGIIISDLVVTSHQSGDRLGFLVVSGTTGEPQDDVRVTVYGDRDKRKIRSCTTGDNGRAFVSLGNVKNGNILAQRGQEFSLIAGGSFQKHNHDNNNEESFIYVDRPIYRPGQEVQWKIVAYAPIKYGREYETLSNKTITVNLRDHNNRIAGTIETTTNEFGSASGSFVIPEGALLGRWRLDDSLDGYATFNVEEYKRPTFEVFLENPEGELHLGQNVHIQGRAKYYFGQPVTGGRVSWRVARDIYHSPSAYSHFTSVRIDTLVSGHADLNTDGSFDIKFLAVCDSILTGLNGVSYQYTVHVEVLNPGGELHAQSRRYHIGSPAVKAVIKAESGFVKEGTDAVFSVLRSNLAGVPQVGAGSYMIYELDAPAGVTLPCDAPRTLSAGLSKRYCTVGDTLKSRWAGPAYWENEVRGWPIKDEVAAGDVEHDKTGQGSISVPGLRAGVYQLKYETLDQEGNKSTQKRFFIVAGPHSKHLPLGLLVLTEKRSIGTGEVARFLVQCGLADQLVNAQLYLDRELLSEKLVNIGKQSAFIEIPITEKMQGRIVLYVSTIQDFQFFKQSRHISVTQESKKLDVEIITFRDHLVCGTEEILQLKIIGADGESVSAATTELLAYMYDRSLDALGNKNDPNVLGLFSSWRQSHRSKHGLGRSHSLWNAGSFVTTLPSIRPLEPGHLLGIQNNSVIMRAGQLYIRGGRSGEVSMQIDGVASTLEAFDVEGAQYMVDVKSATSVHSVSDIGDDGMSGLRQNFSETAFFLPHVKIDKNGEANISFQVPDSATDWKLVLHALTTNLRSGTLVKTASSSNDLLVRPYLPRFLREGDRAEVKVVLNNETAEDLLCLVDLQILDEKDSNDISHSFGLKSSDCLQVPVTVPAHGENSLTFNLDVPKGVGLPTLRVMGRTGHLSDGEQRPLPILPSRMYLQQSQFAALDGLSSKIFAFEAMSGTTDATLQNEKLVLSLDGQLFQSALSALPYLETYPYECTEQMLNSYLSTSIMSVLYSQFPPIEDTARQESNRETKTPAWDKDDPNRRMIFEESPWLNTAQGELSQSRRLINLLDPEVADKNREKSLAKLGKRQDSSGGFPWFSGGEPSVYLTCYVLNSFARGQEFGLEIPSEIARKAWNYLDEYYHRDMAEKLQHRDENWAIVTYLSYLLTCYGEDYNDVTGFTEADKESLLAHSFKYWKSQSRMMKSYLSLSLARHGRLDDARVVFDSVLDRANIDTDLGLSWTPEDRSWLWTRDTIEGHAFALRVMAELYPDDLRARGMVKWLLLNRKLRHWKSTRATAEVIYALAHYMDRVGELDLVQEISVRAGHKQKSFKFEPKDVGNRNQRWVFSAEEMVADLPDSIVVTSETKGLVFASATWHFSTEHPPAAGEGDLLNVTRKYFRRVNFGNEWKLILIEAGDPVAIGDQIEVHLAISSRFPVEYIQLRDPRPAGFEPEGSQSGYRWQMGLSYYEEIRDNGANFFFEQLPDGQFTMKHRLRANMAGEFLVGPATLQSMYAPEFTAYSSGGLIEVKESIK